MLTIDPKEIKSSVLHGYLLGAVAPRPIAFASTMDKEGNPNLSPFSFFNVFSSNPPIAVFSPARSGRTGLTKHTFDNIKETMEVVINVVNYSMVNQMSLASTEYPKGVNEFVKSGFTPIPSEKVKPFRVKESPAQLECKVKQIIELGNEGGAGNLIICEVVLMHINENVLDENKQIDPNKIDLVARLGANWYSRTNGNSLFEVAKPLLTLGIGVDQIPAEIRNSKILTGNNLGQLGNIEKLPSKEEIESYKNSADFKESAAKFGKDKHLIAKSLLDNNKPEDAWKVLLSEQ
ncbi:MAG: flavin reductase family protein [Bacteroidetes bacterium]|jgi:flavin reductase (DIM6/NTAB) family NADH-FMN oxidoreductase RutF|nr:flavin reductase family protein [Bacteroidota bacterium]